MKNLLFIALTISIVSFIEAKNLPLFGTEIIKSLPTLSLSQMRLPITNLPITNGREIYNYLPIQKVYTPPLRTPCVRDGAIEVCVSSGHNWLCIWICNREEDWTLNICFIDRRSTMVRETIEAVIERLRPDERAMRFEDEIRSSLKELLSQEIEESPCEVKPCFSYDSKDLTAQFKDNSFSTYPIVAYHWDFGDGIWANGNAPIHTYAKEGGYVVCLTVYADNGFGLCECIGRVCYDVSVKLGGGVSGSSCGILRGTQPEKSVKLTTTKPSGNLKMTVFPNPVNNDLTVVFDKKVLDTEGGNAQLEVYNLQGQILKNQKLDIGLDETRIPMQSMPVGVYMISLRQNGQIVSTVKVTKD